MYKNILWLLGYGVALSTLFKDPTHTISAQYEWIITYKN